MKPTIIKSKYVCGLNNRLTIQFGVGSFNIGLIIIEKQVRLMLIFWHVCFNKNK